MANNTSRSAGLGALLSAMLAAVQWRLLLLWLLIMLIPATVVAWPLLHMLGGMLDSSVHAAQWAQHFSAAMFTDVMFSLSDHAEWFGATAMIGLVLTLLLSPFLDGMIVGSGRAERVLGFGALLQNGLIEYGRMFRLMLWSLLPYALVAAVAGLGMHLADKHAEKAVLESQADRYASVAHWVLLVVFVLIQSIVESARAAFIADTTLRSAMRALWRGIRQLFRRPLRTLLFYVVVTLIGLVLASVFGVARVHVTAFGLFGFVLAIVLGQLIVLAIGWMRTARLFALADVARSVVPGPGPQAEYR
ncbi:hypothetical protein GCM10007862_19410 [Dyella lipolytica]|uniref:Membrane domain of glycerophosphoryl diester phosphodiesterase n=1 Tax=Dyella lipolytica TaxID=1867835 RepID=A0ABW8ISD1_9GAMM|nr:hypothetical protein [Dyella lipolytica]GLQ46890.1 hypothetical protein GCM10007862_19410 [Dyella lipolytica]